MPPNNLSETDLTTRLRRLEEQIFNSHTAEAVTVDKPILEEFSNEVILAQYGTKSDIPDDLERGTVVQTNNAIFIEA